MENPNLDCHLRLSEDGRRCVVDEVASEVGMNHWRVYEIYKENIQKKPAQRSSGET